MRLTSWKIVVGIVVFAAFFRFWGAFEYDGFIGDEPIIVTSANTLMKYGTLTEWKFPQVNSLVTAGSIVLFGDNPVGWRISGIVLGTASILLVYLIARRLYPESTAPLLAAAMLAFDPFHIHFCRTAMIETPVIFFFLFFLYLMLEYGEKNCPTLTGAGIALGLTVATKAYFVFAIPVVVAYAFFREFQRNGKVKGATYLEFAVKLIILPMAVYLLTYIFWFGRGYTLPEFFQFRSDAYWVFSHNYKFAHEQMLAQGGKPWEWFIKPISFGHHLFSDGQHGRFTIEINNPLFRLMVFPSLCVVLYHAVKKRLLPLLIAPLLFTACYLLFFVTNRPFNSYSALALLPFAYMMVAHAVTSLAEKYHCSTEVTILFLSAVCISGCYLFPVSTGFLVPTAIYKPVLSITTLTRVF